MSLLAVFVIVGVPLSVLAVAYAGVLQDERAARRKRASAPVA
jgi:hypothetical protein